jgi:hypothetical protein
MAADEAADRSTIWCRPGAISAANVGNFKRPQSGKLRCPLTSFARSDLSRTSSASTSGRIELRRTLLGWKPINRSFTGEDGVDVLHDLNGHRGAFEVGQFEELAGPCDQQAASRICVGLRSLA